MSKGFAEVKNVASSQGYLEFVLEQLSGLEDVSHRAMYDELPALKKR